ncbi:MAG: cobalamin biosynthesis protein CobW [Puniceicoccaceae bacterium 5H]|nr:MAG: cobalamin biosynthesis protein CobW [Puniceicoccaceae bacterium 5H]
MKTPVTIVTGFLGSGKSTLLMNLLTQCKDRRIAVIVNEFGEIGIDGNLIQSTCGCEEGSVMELKNGCVCCTVQEEFLPTMKKLLQDEEPFDHIIVETSGLALPKPLLKAVNWPDLKPLLTVDAVITVVDADGLATGEICDRERVQAQREADESLDHETPIEELFEDQLSCADLVVLTKCDLVEPQRREDVTQMLKARLRPNIRIVEAERGSLPAEIALGVQAGAEDDLTSRRSRHDEHHHHHDHDHHHDHHHHDESIDTVALKPGPIADPKAFEREMQALCDRYEVYRIKGFLDVAGKPMRLVMQGVGKRFESYFDRPWQPDEERQSYVVVIGHELRKAGLSN